MPSTEVLMPLAFCETMLIELVLISLKTSFSVSPFSRLTPLKLESSASLSSWLRRSLNCVIRFLRTVLPPIVAVFDAPVSPLMTPPDGGADHRQILGREVLDATLPLSLDAFTLPVRLALALMPATIWSTVCAVAPVVEAGRRWCRKLAATAGSQSTAPVVTATLAVLLLTAVSDVKVSAAPVAPRRP